MNIELKRDKVDLIIKIIIIMAVFFMTHQWNRVKSELESIKQQQDLQYRSHLTEISSVFHQVDATLSQYDFPISDEVKTYYQDSLKKDHHHFNYHWHQVYNTSNYLDFNPYFEKYSIQIEDVLNQLNGLEYSDAEKKLASDAFKHASGELYTLVTHKEFSFENVENQEEILHILKQLAERLAVLDKV